MPPRWRIFTIAWGSGHSYGARVSAWRSYPLEPWLICASADLSLGRPEANSGGSATGDDFPAHTTQRFAEAIRGTRLEEDLSAFQRLPLDAYQVTAVRLQTRSVTSRRKLPFLRIGGDHLAIAQNARDA